MPNTKTTKEKLLRTYTVTDTILMQSILQFDWTEVMQVQWILEKKLCMFSEKLKNSFTHFSKYKYDAHTTYLNKFKFI